MREIELIEKRKRREKHFLQEDGTIIAKIYSEDVHYLDNGKYEEIDNTLIEENEYYTNRKNSYKVQFSKQTQKKLMKLENSNHYLDIKLEQEKTVSLIKEMKSNNFMDKVKYKNILDNIDLEYKVLPNKVKESIIIKERINIPSRISFIVDTDLNLILNSDKSISAIKDGNTYFVIDAPYMVDAEGKTNKNIYYELVSDVNGYKLNLILDTIWLNNKDVLYPIVIDPTITNRGDEINIYDTYIYPGDTGVDKNSKDILKAGVERVNGNDVINRTLIKFDLPVIGTGSQIIDANLQLIGYPSEDSTYSQDIMEVRRITSEWNETSANWNNMNDKFDNSRIDGSFYAQRSYAIGSIIPVPTQCFVDLTDLVKRWYTDLPNNGIMIKCNNEVYKNDKFPAFFSKNNSLEGYNPKPIIQITYRNQNGLEEYMKYASQYYFNGSSHVNLYNGNFTTIFNIGSTIGNKFPAKLSIVYNTNDVVLNNNIGYGVGFRLNYHQTINEKEISNQTYLEYVDGDGTIHYFSKNRQYVNSSGQVVTVDSENVYYDEDGLNMKIEKNNNEYILYDKNKNKMKFILGTNGTAYLKEIQDTSNNKISIVYNNSNKIEKIIDGDLYEILLTYPENKILVNYAEKTAILTFDNNKLISISDINGIVNFSYNDKCLINQIKDINEKKMQCTYYEQYPYKIKTILEKGIDGEVGKTLEFNYKFSSTTINDNKNKTTTLSFNKYGNVSSVTNLKSNDSLKNAYGKSLYYGERYQSKNKILANELPIKYVKNYMINSSFEGEQVLFSSTEKLTASISPDISLSGNCSLKLVSETGEETSFYKSTVPKGEYYNFSAYIKNNNNIKMVLSYTNINDEVITKESEEICSSNEFERYDISIYYPSDAKSDLYLNFYFINSGTAFVDDIQLEEGQVANNYNYIDSSYFNKELSSWGVAGDTTNYEVVTLNENVDALRIKMNPGVGTSFGKDFNFTGKEGDVFNISFWYKNCGLHADGVDAGGMIYNNVSINYIYDNDMGHGIPLSLPLEPNQEEWQFFTCNFIANSSYKGLSLSFLQIMNANDLYIANISLYKGIKSKNLGYDENGNLSSSKTLSDFEVSFNYDNNSQLISKTDFSGQKIALEYDNLITDRIIGGIFNSGISNKVSYNENGNLIITKMDNKTNLSNIENGIYKLRLKGTKEYLCTIGNKIVIKSESISNDRWTIEKCGLDEENTYTIKHSILSNKYLTLVNNEILLQKNQNSNSLFYFIKNKNGSYSIKCKSNGLYLKKNNNNFELAQFVENDSNFEIYFETISNSGFLESNAYYGNDGKFITMITDSLLNKTNFSINEQTGLINYIVNAENFKTEYIFNDKEQLIKVIFGDRCVEYKYNLDGMLSEIIHSGKSYKFFYDNFLRIKFFKISDNILLINNNYDSYSGNILSSVYGNDDVISFNYDKFDRVSKIIKMNDFYNYLYDSNGLLSKIESNNDIEKNYYDLAKRVIQYQYNNFKIKYLYDLNDNVVNKKYFINNIGYNLSNSFNNDDLIIKTEFDSDCIEFNYDYLGRIINKKINNQYNINYEYLKNGNRTSLFVKTIDNNGYKIKYKYNKLNNITHIYNNDKLKNKFFYDKYGQLIMENDYQAGITIRYKYDNSGNILSKAKYELDTYNMLSKDIYEYSNVNWEDQLTKFNNDVIVYDNIGNPVSIGNNILLEWTNGRELIRYNDNEKNIIYKYNQDGFRTSKNINNVITNYFFEGNKLILEKTNNNVIYYLRNDIDDLIGFKYNNNVYYYIKNAQNDIVGIMDNNFTLIGKYEYDSFGKVLSVIDSNGNDVSNSVNHILNINPFRYRSYYYDNETNLYYLKSRYYSPTFGRFINADNYISTDTGFFGYNMYSYCRNNFINYFDSDGHAILASFLVGIAAVGAAFLVNSISKGNKAKKEIDKVQRKKNIPDKTKELNKKLKNSASELQKSVANKNYVEKLVIFKEQVTDDAKYDIKLQEDWNQPIMYEGIVMDPQDVGNFHYGYIGRSIGIPTSVLIAGAGYNQLDKYGFNTIENCFSFSLCDDPRDTYYINLGIIKYDSEN